MLTKDKLEANGFDETSATQTKQLLQKEVTTILKKILS